jgi:hypothetical protein
MSYKSLISLIAVCALLALTAVPAGIAVAKKKSGDGSTALTTCTETGAFPSAETEDESGTGKPPGQIGKKPSPGQIGNKSDDDACGVGALPGDKIDID